MTSGLSSLTSLEGSVPHSPSGLLRNVIGSLVRVFQWCDRGARVKRGVVNVARFARVLLASRGWPGAQPTREATGCHGWLAAAPVGGSGWQPRPRSGGQGGPTLCCRGGGRLGGRAAARGPAAAPQQVVGRAWGRLALPCCCCWPNRPRAHDGRENHAAQKIESTTVWGPHITHAGL